MILRMFLDKIRRQLPIILAFLLGLVEDVQNLIEIEILGTEGILMIILQVHWLKVDFSKWKDEDEVDDEKASAGMGGFDFGGGADGFDLNSYMSKMGGAGAGGIPDLDGFDDEGAEDGRANLLEFGKFCRNACLNSIHRVGYFYTHIRCLQSDSEQRIFNRTTVISHTPKSEWR